MPLRGDLASFSLVEIFQFLAVNQSSGTLTVSDGENRRTLVFHRGALRPVGAAQSYVPRLGDLLVRRGVISEAQLATALEKQKTGAHARLGDLLVAEGLVTAQQIHDAARQKLEEEIYDLFLWKNAFFDFVREDAAPPPETAGERPLEFHTSALLMEAVRRQDEWGEISASVPSLRHIFVAAGPLPAEPGPANVVRVAAALAPEHSVREVIELTGHSKFDVCKVLDQLRRAAQVRPLPTEAAALAFDDALRGARFEVGARLLEYAMDLGPPARPVRERMLKAFVGDRGIGTATTPVRLTGPTEAIDLPLVLPALLLRRLTATLRLRDLESERVLTLSPKEIVLRTRGVRETPKVGQVLLLRGRITQRQLDKALALQREDPRPVGQLLVASGAVDAATVEDAVLAKVVQEIFDLFLWRNAFAELTTGAPAAEEAPGDARPTRLALDSGTAHRDLVGRVAGAVEILGKIASSRAILVPTGRDARARRRAGDDAETEVLALLNGVRTVHDLFRLTSRPNTEVCETLAALLTQGLVRPLALDEVRRDAEAALRRGQIETCLKLCRYGEELAPGDPGCAALVSEAAGRRPAAGGAPRECRLEGDLQAFSLAELMQSLYLNKHSGTLRVRDGRREKIVYFAEGSLALLTRGDSEVGRIGEILIDLGKITETDVERALEAQGGTGKRLGEILVEQGRVAPEDIQLAVETKVRDELFDAFLWKAATFEFLKNYFPDEFTDEQARVTRLALDTTRTLMEAIARMERWEKLAAEFGTLAAIHRPADPAAVAGCSRRARQLVPLVDGRRTLAGVCDDAPTGRFAALEGLHELWKAGAIRPLTLDELNTEAEAAFTEREFERCVGFYEYAIHLDSGNEHLRRFLAAAKGNLATLDASRVRMKPFDLVQLFRLIVDGGVTGTLTARDGTSMRQVYLGKDECVWAQEGPRPAAPLGAALARRGVGEKVFTKAAEAARRLSRDVGEVLAAQGACTPEALADARRELAAADCEDLFAWREATIEFERDAYAPRLDDPAVHATRATLDVPALLGHLADRREQWDRYRAAVPSERTILKVADPDPTGAPLARRHRESPIFALVDGRRTVREILTAAGGAEFDAYHGLHDLCTARVVRPLTVAEAAQAAESAWVFRDLDACEAYLRHGLELDRNHADLQRRLELVTKGRETAVRRRISAEFAAKADVPAILQAVVRDHRWGTLEAGFEDRVRILHFEPAALYLLASGGMRGRRLGERLIQWGRATPPQVEKALAAQKRGPRKLGEILVLQGVLTETALAAALREKVLEDLHEVVAWPDLRVRFRVGDPPPELTDPTRRITELRGDTAALLSEALEREIGWREIAEAVPDLRVIFVRRDGAPESRRADAGGKNPVLALVSGRRSVDEVLQKVDVPRFEGLRALVRLIRNNVIAPLTLDQCRTAADQAYQWNDLAATRTLLQYACTLAPDDEALQRRLARLDQGAAKAPGPAKGRE